MPPLYVVQQNAKLRIENRHLLVERDGEPLASLPLGQVSQVVLFGNIGLTTPAMHALLAHSVEVVLLSQDGAFLGRILGEMTPHVPLRRAQYRRLDQPGFALEVAKGFVRAKLGHQKALLQRHNRQQPHPDISAAVAAITREIEDIPRKTALSSLLGLEGAATAAYFRGYRRLFTSEWRFQDRNRRPPRDPVNVLLSLGYTLLASITQGAVQAAGLDPYAGFLHEVAYNRPALALDIMEEFRPVVDGVALWACRSRQLTPADFRPGPPERPILLSQEGQKRFLKAFEQRMDQRFTHPRRGVQLTLRQCLLEQARQVAERILNDQPGYQGMGFR